MKEETPVVDRPIGLKLFLFFFKLNYAFISLGMNGCIMDQMSLAVVFVVGFKQTNS